MEFENILKLIDSVSASSLDSFVYEQNGTKIKLEKKKQKIWVNGSSALSAEQLLTGAKVGLTTEGSAVRAAGTAAEPGIRHTEARQNDCLPSGGRLLYRPVRGRGSLRKGGRFGKKGSGCGHRGSHEADERDYQRL